MLLTVEIVSMEFLKKVADDRKIKLLEDRLGSGQSFEPLTIQKNVSIPTTTTTALTSVGITSSVTANVVTTATNGNTVTSASDNSAMNIVNPSTELHSEIVPLSDNMISSTNSNSDDNHNHSHNSINSNSNSYPSTVHSSAVDKIATNNENNEINENNENHSIRVINESSNASLVGVPLFDNSNTERDSRSCYSIDGEVSNEGKRKSSGSDKDREKSPKQKKAEVLENLSPENQG